MNEQHGYSIAKDIGAIYVDLYPNETHNQTWSKRQKQLENVILDVDQKGRVIGIEILTEVEHV